MVIGKDFLEKILIIQEIILKFDKWDYRKLEGFYIVRESIS